jgi:hypothetical protein
MKFQISMSKRKKRNKATQQKQSDTFNKLAVSPVNSLHRNDSPDNKNNTDKNEKESKPMPRIKEWWSNLGDPKNSNRVVAIFTIVIALTGITYSWFAYKQWKAIDGQLDQMQDNSRPYLIPALPKFGEAFPQNFNQIKLTPAYINGGNSPALKVTPSKPRIAIDTDSGVKQEIEKCSFTYVEGSEDFLAPTTGQNQIGNLTQTVETRFIPDKERDEFILTGKEHIVLFGGIKYTGIHGGDYETAYCFSLNGQSLRDPTVAAWSPCSCKHIK